MRHLFFVAAFFYLPANAMADEAAAQRWIDDEFQPSTLSKDEQMSEMQWFIEAAQPYSGMEINVLSEGIPTHSYESEVLTKAFEEITGIKVNHQILGEGEVVQAVQTQMQTGRNLYDGYVNDSDLIGTHSRLQLAYPLTDMMEGGWAGTTSPTLDLDDFMGIQFTTGPDGKLYQLPDQQFANLYWFRKDWFDDEANKAAFKEKYGYDLGVPVNWSAYEDIAEFFTNDVKEVDGVAIYGHMDYGKRAPDLGWRMTDAWLSMAGAGDKGEPNGVPVDEWGIRMEAGTCNPVGASVSRGGAANGPAAVYAIRKWDEWLRNYAPPGAASYDFYQSLPALSQGNVAQQIFWYTAFTADMVKPKSDGNNTVDDEGTPLWRMAPSPHGSYWEEGQKVGYQDVGSWTFLKSTPPDRAQAAWLYAQFVTSKTVDVKKSHVGLTFTRDSSVNHESFTERAPKLGGLVEFYRSPDRVAWSPTGINVPDYPKLAQIWWQQIGEVNSGTSTPQEAMDRLAEEMDITMARMQAADESAGVYGGCGPRLNEPQDASFWLEKAGSPKAKLENEKPQGQTVNYDDLVRRWRSEGANPPNRYPSLVTDEMTDYYQVSVFFGTNRKNRGSVEKPSFGAERDQVLQLGSVVVTIPLTHKVGEIEKPYLRTRKGVPMPSNPDPREHFTLKSIDLLDHDTFQKGVSSMIGRIRNPQRSAIIYIHGYNVGFDHAAFRIAQITHDLAYDGIPFFYSWPSKSAVEKYEYDQQSARQTRRYLSEFLKVIMSIEELDEVNLIAHSMGNDPLLESINELVLQGALREKTFNEVILAAPDIDEKVFLELADNLIAVSDNVTLYASGNDRALDASKAYAGGVPRAGDVPSNKPPIVVADMETIDATAVNTDFFSIRHNDYVENRLLLEDIASLINDGVHPPSKRNHTIRTIPVQMDLQYWLIPN